MNALKKKQNAIMGNELHALFNHDLYNDDSYYFLFKIFKIFKAIASIINGGMMFK